MRDIKEVAKIRKEWKEAGLLYNSGYIDEVTEFEKKKELLSRLRKVIK